MKPLNNDVRTTSLLTLLAWEGRLSNGRLRELFGLSSIRVSEWLRDFRELHPDSVAWDSKTKSHIATNAFFRDLAGTEAAQLLSRYIVMVGLPVAQSNTNQQQVVWAAYPDLYTPKPQVFSTVLLGVQLKRAVDIEYRSMTTPRPHRRIISPHSLVRVGRRWHARAYCHLKEQFRDFNLGRISSIRLCDESQASFNPAVDDDWEELVKVRIGVHPSLAPEQSDVIRFEHFNDTASLTHSCKGPLVSYFVQDVKAAVDVKSQLPPDYQLAVENVEEIKKWLFQS
jgi:hypothetical protein